MVTTEQMDQLLERLDRIEAEIREVRKTLLVQAGRDKPGGEAVWEDLLSMVDEVSRLWKGPGVVEEIRDQSEKAW